MEDVEKVKSNIRGFLRRKYNISIDDPNINIQLKKLDGLSNVNFHCIITNLSTNEEVVQIVYRKFGEISDVIDRDMETGIINFFAEKGMGPSIFERDLVKSSYRIDEFVKNSVPIPKSLQFDPIVLDQIIEITANYNIIAPIFKYSVTGANTINITRFDVSTLPEETKHINFNQNIYMMCVRDMYNKCVSALTAFAKEFRNTYSREQFPDKFKELEKLEYYSRNYHEIFARTWPNEGFIVLNHNDVHRLNLIVKKSDNKLFVLDHEYSALNMIGNDIANYMNESNFIYYPEYTFLPDDIDFDLYYQAYKKYINRFIELHPQFANSKEGKAYLAKIINKRYYINLHCILNIFWFLYCGLYLNFKSYHEQGDTFYFIHGIHRIMYYEAGLAALAKLK